MDSLNYLYVLPYDISEELFKQKVGTGDYLNELLEKGYIDRTDKGIKIRKVFFEGNSKSLSKDEMDKLHTDIIESFYIPKLQEIQVIDYDDFIKYYDLYINLSYHYREISRYDDAIQQIALIAKKMQYWGMKDVLIDSLTCFSDDKLSKESQLIKTYYSLFSRVLDFSHYNDDVEKLKSKFISLEQTKEKDFLLYLESKNLEGIFLRICKKDISKAIRLHNDTIELIKKQVNEENSYSLVCGRTFENLSFCYQQQKETEKAEEAMKYAQENLQYSNDSYELAKLYFYKALFYYDLESEESLWISYLKEVNVYLNKYRFPDIERKLYNLLCRIEIEKFKKFDNYFSLKLRVLDCDMVLYNDYFVIDFINMYEDILNNKDKNKEQIVEGLKGVVVFLNDTNFEDEKMFLKAVGAYLNGEEYLCLKNQIKNKSLVKLIDEFN